MLLDKILQILLNNEQVGNVKSRRYVQGSKIAVFKICRGRFHEKR